MNFESERHGDMNVIHTFGGHAAAPRKPQTLRLVNRFIYRAQAFCDGNWYWHSIHYRPMELKASYEKEDNCSRL